MSVTVAAGLKRAAVAILTDKKLLKTIGGIVLGIIIIIIMPIVAIISIFNGDLEFDYDRLNELVVENLSDDDRAKLQQVDDTMLTLETQMTDAGFEDRFKEAQALYVLGLFDYSDDDDFAETLVGCFAEDQTDEELVDAVNDAFGTNISVEDFIHTMENIITN